MAEFETYFSFAFVRNPWDVAVSWFHYRLLNPHIAGHAEAFLAGTFERYVCTELAGADGMNLAGQQGRYVTDSAGAVAVTYVGRYETLAEDYASVLARLNVTALVFDHFNQSYHAPWQQLYTAKTFELVRRLIQSDADLFNYPDVPEAYGIH